MLQLSLRPLVPLSALALLGWCWYTLWNQRKPRKRMKEELSFPVTKKQSVVEKVVVVQEVALSGNALAGHTEICGFRSQGKNDDDQILNGNLSQLGSTMDIAQDAVLTSTPIEKPLNGIRPEPEGEVARAQASLLLAEKSETALEQEVDDDDDAVKGHSKDFKAIETESFVQQPTEIACPKEHSATDVYEKQSEKTPSLNDADSLFSEVIDGATEEITAIGGGILKRKGHVELMVTPQSQEIDVSNSLGVVQKDLCAFTKTAEGTHKPSQAPSSFPVGEDSGCSMCHSEDGGAPEKACSMSQAAEKTSSAVLASSESRHDLAQKNEKLSKQKALALKGANGIEIGVSGKRAAQSRNSPHILWNIEVPAHLVGRLIGKKGKYISSLKQSSGAKVYVSTLSYTYEFQICHIEGSEVQVEKALALIRKKFKDLDLRNRLSSLQPAAVHSLHITSWLMLPQDGTVEVIAPRVEAANYLFVQQHTHPTYYSLCSLTEQMRLCYCHSECPSLPTPVEAGVLCAAPSPDGGWWRAQVIQHYKDSNIVQIRYVDYGGYVTVNLSSLKQIRSDFVTLPFQASEVMLENIAPLPGSGKFSCEAKTALEELTQGIPLIMKVTGSQNGLPLVHMWRNAGEEMISVNGTLVERGLCSWLDSY